MKSQNFLYSISGSYWESKTLEKSDITMHVTWVHLASFFYSSHFHLFHKEKNNLCTCGILIHEADPQPRLVVITIFSRVVCTSDPTFQNLANQNKVQASMNSDRYWSECGSGRVDH